LRSRFPLQGIKNVLSGTIAAWALPAEAGMAFGWLLKPFRGRQKIFFERSLLALRIFLAL
jgi:hypothetical protein